MMMP